MSSESMGARLIRPVEAGFWKLHETFDGTYIADDLFDILEIMDIKAENAIRARDYDRRKNAK